MSINNIDFSARQLAGLYTKNLVILEKGDGVEKNVKEVPENRSTASEMPGSTKNMSPLAPSAAPQSTPTAIPHLGDFNKKVLIVVQYPQEPFIPAAALQFLTNILTACKLSIQDVAIYNLHHHPGLQYDYIMETLRPKVCILLGVDFPALKAPFIIPEFQTFNYNHAQFVAAPALDAMNTPTEEAKLLKSKLWANLKGIFLA